MIDIEIITHSTEKTVNIYDVSGSLINSSVSNTVVTLPYDSYIIYLTQTSELGFTQFLSHTHQVLLQLLGTIFVITLGYIYINLFKYIKNKGLH